MARRVQYQVRTEPIPQPLSLAWIQSWAEPTRLLPRFSPYDVAEPIPQPPATVTWGWFEPFSDPTRLQRTADFPAVHVEPLGQPPTWGWFTPLSDPVFTPRRAADFPFLAFRSPTQSETPWFEPWSEPTRRPQQFSPYDVAEPIPQPGPAAPVNWRLSPLADPVRVPLSPVRGTIVTGFLVTPVPAPPDSWYQPWSEPVRVKLRSADFTYEARFPGTPPTPPAPAQFLSPLSEPMRQVPRFTESWWFTGPPRVIVNPPPPTSQFPNPTTWSEPVRLQPRTAFFDFEAYQNVSFITPSLFLVPAQPTYQPYRPIPPIDVRNWEYFNINLTPQLMPPTYSWKVIPPAPILQSHTLSLNQTTLNVPEVVTMDKWVYHWSLPVRTKPRAADFPTLALEPFLNPPAPSQVTLQATERKDVWSMTVTESVTPFTAKVGVVELPTPAGAVGVIEES